MAKFSPKTKIKTMAGFKKAINALVAQKMRQIMDKDIHVLIFREVEFRKLLRQHEYKLNEVIEATKNKNLKRQLKQALKKENTNEIAKELYLDFAKICERHLKSTSNVIVEDFSTESGSRIAYRFRIKKGKRKQNLYKHIQRRFSKIKVELYKNSNKGKNQTLLSTLIAGVSIQTDTLSNITAKEIDKEARAQKTGIQLGHTRGAAAVAASEMEASLERVENLVSFPDDIALKLSNKVTEVDAADARISLNKIGVGIGKRGLSGNIGISVLTLEGTKVNLEEGRIVQELLKELREFILYNAEELIDMKHSKSIRSSVEDLIVDTFVGKRNPGTKYSDKDVNIPIKVKGKVPVTQGSLVTKSDIAAARAIIEELNVDGDQDLNSKIPYLNTRLHDKIQQNMGKGRSKQILNYRTGRFARSAEIEQFLPSKEKGTVNAVVKYMRYPYGTFEPGGRLATTPGRDPHRIFGRSIRQLLQEEKIATLRRVKVQLRG